MYFYDVRWLLPILCLLSFKVVAQEIVYSDTLILGVNDKPVQIWLMPEKNEQGLFLHVVLYDTILHKTIPVLNKHEIEFDFLRDTSSIVEEISFMCRDTLCKRHILPVFTKQPEKLTQWNDGAGNGFLKDYTTTKELFSQKQLAGITIYAEELGTSFRHGDVWAGNVFRRQYEAYIPEPERARLLKWFQ
jgi:hypothetical protein